MHQRRAAHETIEHWGYRILEIPVLDDTSDETKYRKTKDLTVLQCFDAFHKKIERFVKLFR